MFWIKKKLEKLQLEFEQYKYDQSNLPKYCVGQKLSDGTIITKVEKSTGFVNEYKVHEYYWIYEGFKNGRLTNSFEHHKITANDYYNLISDFKKQAEAIEMLQWQINNPPKYKIGQKVKGYGECFNYDIIEPLKFCTLEHDYVTACRRYEYTFKNKNKTITVCE